jgi:hypothetical protein
LLFNERLTAIQLAGNLLTLPGRPAAHLRLAGERVQPAGEAENSAVLAALDIDRDRLYFSVRGRYNTFRATETDFMTVWHPSPERSEIPALYIIAYDLFVYFVGIWIIEPANQYVRVSKLLGAMHSSFIYVFLGGYFLYARFYS